ncbi:YwqJ-related putative deaminase [Glycomyces buryatensis]|uniref:YwqJ-like deaminase n=1 Tax=Glycomyces buryatensis TaxID=2570927 RepID=A0A4S8QCU7_9ACTN|nr:YwqJ-related putative deaminase [Glycomyces buryatensis]THV41401.1 hypothetical protein FAB82_11410 [Glycomyces buryatensis]
MVEKNGSGSLGREDKSVTDPYADFKNPNKKKKKKKDPVKPSNPNKAPTHLTPTGDPAADRARLRDALLQKLAEVSDDRYKEYWGPGRRQPCMSAVWDRESGRIYYNHNTKMDVTEESLEPPLKERFKKYDDGDPSWKKLEPETMPNPRGSDLPDIEVDHGVPGQHAEVRGMNEALRDARSDGRDPDLSEFMVENVKVNKEGSEGYGDRMACCENCAQMLDGADGAWDGWDRPYGNKTGFLG